jgi:xanthine dehydrogenase large subunit
VKRGIAFTPVSSDLLQRDAFNQAGALNVYTDGTVLVNHGGTEMGQGLYTKVLQVVANMFGVPLEVVRECYRHQQGAEHLGHRGLVG